MGESKIRYKVTSKTNRSCVVHYNPYVIRYEPNKWVEARIGGCLVFNTLQNARNFALLQVGILPLLPSGKPQIWKCEVKNYIQLPKYSILTPNWSHKNMEELLTKLWSKGYLLPEDLNCPPLYASRSPWPIGTEAYEQVKLLTCVEA